MYFNALNQALTKDEFDPMFRYVPQFNVAVVIAKFIIVVAGTMSIILEVGKLLVQKTDKIFLDYHNHHSFVPSFTNREQYILAAMFRRRWHYQPSEKCFLCRCFSCCLGGNNCCIYAKFTWQE
jgi:hypothetical protein